MTKTLHQMARKTLARHVRHGLSKSEAKKSKKISAIGTERNYRQCLSNYYYWCEANGIVAGTRAQRKWLTTYLGERSEWVQQKTLNQERLALSLVFQQKLPHFCSQKATIQEKRSYCLEQVKQIVARQTPKNAITSWLAFFSSVRAHEPVTLLPITMREPSLHRQWDERLFQGYPEYKRYTVVGKGGLIRLIAIPLWLSGAIEARRRPSPVRVVDREIIYWSLYDIGFGQSWSQSFSAASKAALGFSQGGHGLRHSYAKWRLNRLLDQGMPIGDACRILSQELGHFRIDITTAYLR